MFSKPLLMYIGMDSPYLIYRLTYDECQAYHDSLTLGYVIKNRDEKFKVVAIANNQYIPNHNYIYGNSDDPYCNVNILESQWYELRIYCDDSIMNLGEFSIRDFSEFMKYNQSPYSYCFGNGQDSVYDASGGYYSIYRNDRGQLYSPDNLVMFQNTILSIQQSFNSYANYITNNNLSDITEADFIRTVSVEYDYSSEYLLNVEGLLVSVDSDALVANLSYSSQNLSIQNYSIYVNNNLTSTFYGVNSMNDSRTYNIPTDVLVEGTNVLRVIARLSDNSESIVEKTFVCNSYKERI